MMMGYIVDALLELLKTIPYPDITICQITKKAGVNRSTYYRHFTSKESVVKYYYKTLLIDFRKHSLASQNQKLQQYLCSMFAYFLQHKKQLIMLHKYHLSYLYLESLNETFIEINPFIDFEHQFSLYYHTGGIFNAFNLWFNHEMKQSPQKMAEISVGLLPSNFSPMLMQ